MPFYSIANDPAAKAIDPRAMIADNGFWITFIAAIFLAPLLETLMNQWFPIWLAMKVTHRPVVAVWFSTVLFGVFHLHAGVYGFVATIGAGYFLAVAFLHARQFGRKRAYWTTAAIHAGVQRHCADGGFDPHPPGDTRAVKISGLSRFQAEKDIDIIRIMSGTLPKTPTLYAKMPLQTPVFSRKLQIDIYHYIQKA